MALFSTQELYCCICGQLFRANISNHMGYFKEACCSKPCLDEKSWRETLSIMGKAYYPKPPKAE